MDAFQKLNSELKIWEFHEEVGKALPHWLPNGGIIRSSIEDFWKQEHLRKEYDLVYTPHIGLKKLWETSGHLELFSEKMYPKISVKASEEYILRPMNCPFHILLYKSEQRTFKQLPIRYAELGTVYRKISSGSSKQMFEVRGFTQDDAHIFCEPYRAQKEIGTLIEFTLFFLKNVFKIEDHDYRIIRRLKPKGSLGKDVDWNTAHTILEDVLVEKEIQYTDEPGKGVFYGPKIDFEIMDPFSNKAWVCSTIQLDIVLAERFNVEFVNNSDERQRPIIIHRTILGSLERFVSILLSRTKGHFPVWLAPCQVAVIPVGGKESDYWEHNLNYAKSIKTTVEKSISDLNPRIRVQTENMSVSDAKAAALKMKIPYIVIVGTNERMTERVAVTCWHNDQWTPEPRHMSVDELANELREKIQGKV